MLGIVIVSSEVYWNPLNVVSCEFSSKLTVFKVPIRKASSPIVFTLFGIVILVNLQP